MKKLILATLFSLFIFGSSSVYALSSESQAKVDAYFAARYYYNVTWIDIDFENVLAIYPTHDSSGDTTSNTIIFKSGTTTINNSITGHDVTTAGILHTAYTTFCSARKTLLEAAASDIELRDALNVIFR